MVGEQRPFPGQAVDIGRLVAHDAVVVSADVGPADVVSPDDKDIGFILRRNRNCGTERHQDRDCCRYESSHCLEPLLSYH